VTDEADQGDDTDRVRGWMKGIPRRGSGGSMRIGRASETAKEARVFDMIAALINDTRPDDPPMQRRETLTECVTRCIEAHGQ